MIVTCSNTEIMHESQGVTSLGSLRGGIISIKEGFFKSNAAHSELILVVNRASRIGLDGSCTFDNPTFLGNDPAIIQFLVNSRGIEQC